MMPRMPGHEPHPAYDEITQTLALTLSYIRDGYRIAAIANQRGVAPSTIRTQVAKLEEMTDCHSIDELAEWWREHDHRWLAHFALGAGVPLPVEE
jgi:DNA-binding NarL/FixJ family response regulator